MGAEIVASGAGIFASSYDPDFMLNEDLAPTCGGFEATSLANKYRFISARQLGLNPGVRFFQPSQASVEIPRKDLPEWGNTRARLKETLRYVVDFYLDGEIENVSSGKKFTSRRYRLPSGHEVSGLQLINATARMDHPGMTAKEVVNIFSKASVIKSMREGYLAYTFEGCDWGNTFESVKETLTYIVHEYMNGDVYRINSSPNFAERDYELPSGERITGNRLLRAVAKLERPEMSPTQALYAIGHGEVARIAREVYLSELYDAQDWKSTFDKLSDTLFYVVDNYYDGDVNRVTTGPGFLRKKHALPSGQRVSGQELLYAVAKHECPAMMGYNAYRAIRGTEVARIAREKYLAELFDEQDWGSTSERMSLTLSYIVDKYFNNDAGMMKWSGLFKVRRFILPSRQRVSAVRLLRAIAKLERPEMSATRAFKDIGVRELTRLAREKYLRILDDTPESFVRAMRLITEEDPGKG